MNETHPHLPPAGPAAVISDVHLGWRRPWRRRVDRLRPLWAGAAAVVFNGDTLSRTTACRPEKAGEILDHIRRCCAADGAEAMFLAGNADFEAVGDDFLTLADGAVLVTHGHTILPGICPWRPEARTLRRAREQALAELPPERRETLAGQLSAARAGLIRGQCRPDPGRRDRLMPLLRVWGFAHRPDRVLSVLRAWRDTPGLAAEFLRLYCPRGRAIIIGHTHRPGIWEIDQHWVINTGSLGAPWPPLAVRVDGQTVTVRRTRRTRGGIHPTEVTARIEV